MSRIIDTAQYLDTVCQLLAEGKTDVPVPVAGNSMCPFLHPGDRVYLNFPREPLKEGQILLFNRPGGEYVLHRLHRIGPDGTLLLLGDNQVTPEPVPAERVRAVVTAATRKGSLLTPAHRTWRFYAHIWPRLRLLRPVIGKMRR